MSDRLKRIALGQGQGKKASSLIEKGIVAGDWVMLQVIIIIITIVIVIIIVVITIVIIIIII